MGQVFALSMSHDDISILYQSRIHAKPRFYWERVQSKVESYARNRFRVAPCKRGISLSKGIVKFAAQFLSSPHILSCTPGTNVVFGEQVESI